MSSLRNIFPKEALDKAIGTKVWIIMRDDQELKGILKSFDDNINMVSERLDFYEILYLLKLLTI